MRRLIIFFLLFPCFTNGQIIKDKTEGIDPNKMMISKNIFRILLSASSDTKFSIAGNYEREIIKPITFVAKVGPAYDRQFTYRDIAGNDQYKWLFNFSASAELRIYYNLKRREKTNKTVKNFSAFYFSIEEQIISKPIYIINKTGNEDLKGRNAEFINIGYQYEKLGTYYNIFFGTKLPGPIYNNVVSGLDLLHIGISIGRAY